MTSTTNGWEKDEIFLRNDTILLQVPTCFVTLLYPLQNLLQNNNLRHGTGCLNIYIKHLIHWTEKAKNYALTLVPIPKCYWWFTSWSGCSSSLNNLMVEMKFSQIKQKILGILFATECFCLNVCVSFTIKTDHKPLVHILLFLSGEKKLSPQIESWITRLIPYTFIPYTTNLAL